jgi:hypothetical protein
MYFQHNILSVKKVDIPATAAFEHRTQLPSMQHGTLEMIAPDERRVLTSRIGSFIFVAPFPMKLRYVTRGIEGKNPFFVTDNSEPIRQNTVDYSQPTRIPKTVS